MPVGMRLVRGVLHAPDMALVGLEDVAQFAGQAGEQSAPAHVSDRIASKAIERITADRAPSKYRPSGSSYTQGVRC